MNRQAGRQTDIDMMEYAPKVKQEANDRIDSGKQKNTNPFKVRHYFEGLKQTLNQNS